MAKFTDAAGTAWVIEISHGAYLRLKRDTKLDLDALRDGSMSLEDLAQLLYGPSAELVPVMECLLGGQVKESGLSVDEFHDRMKPEVIDDAAGALREAILDFFYRRRVPQMKQALDAILTDEAREKTTPADRTTLLLLVPHLAKRSTGSAGSVPASSA